MIRCHSCGKANSEPVVDLSRYGCGYCGKDSLERVSEDSSITFPAAVAFATIGGLASQSPIGALLGAVLGLALGFYLERRKRREWLQSANAKSLNPSLTNEKSTNV